jgi:hypothetical protein
MTSATSPPGGNPSRKRRSPSINLRRSRESTVRGFSPGDVLRAFWDEADNCFRVVIETDNGLRITHIRLTPGRSAA